MSTRHNRYRCSHRLTVFLPAGFSTDLAQATKPGVLAIIYFLCCTTDLMLSSGIILVPLFVTVSAPPVFYPALQLNHHLCARSVDPLTEFHYIVGTNEVLLRRMLGA